MNIPKNFFKSNLYLTNHQKGLWLTLADNYASEAVAGAGFDWVVIDMEHSPNDLGRVLRQLQLFEGYKTQAIVRPLWNDHLLIKQLLDIGAQTILLPCVQTTEEAREAVSATRYPPDGKRGVSQVTRATRFGRVSNYYAQCQLEICVLVQVESVTALENVRAIAGVSGVDGVFIGPADLSASMGLSGQTGHPEVVGAVENAIRSIREVGKAPGVLTADPSLARRYMAAGSLFTGLGLDAALLARAADALVKEFS
jgi:4-hydroxy-2-oxoheptanedioate aldolase